MLNQFAVAAGSIIGRDHKRENRNNQDAFCVRRTSQALVAVACDGCGSGRFTEVGAHLTARLIANAMLKAAASLKLESEAAFWQSVQTQALSLLADLMRHCGGSPGYVMENYFLSTVVAAVITPEAFCAAMIGDGVLAVNGEFYPERVFAGNEPPYLMYGLSGKADASRWSFESLAWRRTADLESFLVGTDGANDLARAAEKPLPGKTELVGPLEQFWREDKYFRNPDAVRRRLTLVNRDAVAPDWKDFILRHDYGHLPDDTTIVAVRRQAEEAREP